MTRMLSEAWWMLLLWGLAAVLFGIAALAWPGISLAFLVALFAAYALVRGTVSILAALSHRREQGWWIVLLTGIAGLAAGIVAMVFPGMTALVLVILIGANAVVSGVLEIAMAIRLRKEITGEWLLALGGAVSIVFGAVVLAYPGPGALALLWLIGVYAIAAGVLFVILAFRVRSLRREPGAAARTSA